MSEQSPFQEITQDDRIFAALSYPVFIIPILIFFMEDKKNRPFIRYHAIQGLMLNVAMYALITVLSISVVGTICVPFVWFISLWPAYDAFRGNWTELPVITNFIKNQGWS